MSTSGASKSSKSRPKSPPTRQLPSAMQPRVTSPARKNYLVASHSIRVTKFGYAIDPVELRYAEITSKFSSAQRRQSDQALDSSQLGHRVLTLIRGFWSQPAWPRGRPMNAKQQQQQEQQLQQLFRITSNENPIDAFITYFRSSSFYPHKRTLGQMSIAPVSPPPPPPASGSLLKSFSQKKRGPGNVKSRAPKSPKTPTDSQTFYMSWIPKNRELAVELVIELCKKIEEVFSSEPRILNIESPCTVLGDIHGNLLDLRTYERSLWPKAPSCLTGSYLFLGDYVDRGEHSVECVLYLFAMKLIAPNKFFLLRGNHEIASIQRQYTFGTECEAKFGMAGRQLWRQFNKAFNVMPIAAIIDNQIFCAHGGIPRSVTDVSSLARDIPTPLENPEIQSPAAWEILWNDPITDSELVAMLEMDNAALFNTTQVGQPSETPADSNQVAPQPRQPEPPQAQQPQPAPQVQPSQHTQQVLQMPGDPAQQQQQSQPRPKQVEDLRPAVTIKSPTEALNAMRQSPFESALSFYIRPAEVHMKTPDKDQKGKERDGAGASKPEPKAAPVVNQPSQVLAESAEQQGQASDTLRSFPSDTSSVASTSPAQLLNDGFVANIKRGTAFLFSDKAVDNFLEVNKFSHVIRAHEVIPTGFAFHGDGRVITIFSSSQYCGLNNQAACCLVDGGRIRILRLDTGDAGE